jgi:hypothetical protein
LQFGCRHLGQLSELIIVDLVVGSYRIVVPDEPEQTMGPEIFDRIERACCYITVFVGGELVSEGTGFAFTETGEVLTAAHVVTGHWPIRHKDYNDPEQVIYCKFPGLPLAAYGVVFCSVELRVPSFSGPVQIDLASLVPKKPFPSAVPYLPARVLTPRLGQRVWMAGFSEELELPFNVDRILERDFPGAKEFRDAMRTGYMADMTGPLVKSGMVGNVVRMFAENSQQGEKIECEVIYVDNSMHSGASGGPVLNEDGDVIGVVSQRAVTRVDVGDDKVNVPSGCTVAISLAPLNYILEKLRRQATRG